MTRFAVLAAALLAASTVAPAQATSTTVSGDLGGTVRSVRSTTLSIGVTSASPALRLLKSHWLTVSTDAKTSIRHNGKTAKLRALRADDKVTLRVQCTYAISNSATRIRCRAVRINSTSPQRPVPVQFAILGSISSLQSNAFGITATSFDNDERSAPVVAALRSAQPINIALETTTVVRLGEAAATQSVLSVGAKVRATVECQPASPFNCRVLRLDIAVPPAEPVILVGLVTVTTPNSVSIDVENATHADSPTVNVRMLRYSGLAIAVAPGVPVTRGSDPVALSSLVPGIRITVYAHCRLSVPFNCTADRVKA